MIKSIKVINYLKESLEIELGSPEKSGLLITSITGLGAGNAVINSSDLSVSDGSVFNSSRLENRNIVLEMKYYGDNPEESRHKTYKYFPIKKPLTIQFTLGDRVCEATGYVESNEADIFSEKAGCSISIICPDPLLYSIYESSTPLSGIVPRFEFPFFREIDDNSEIVMSDIHIVKDTSVHYVGEAEVGISIYIHALGEITDFTIYNTGTREKISIIDSVIQRITGYKIMARDDIFISTIRGAKKATLIRNGHSYNIINAIDKNADWFMLSKGDNIFTYTATTGEFNAQINIKNRIAYEGV